MPSASSLEVRPLVRPGVASETHRNRKGRMGTPPSQQRRQRLGITATEQEGDDNFIFPWDAGGSGPDASPRLSYASGPALGPCSSPAASGSGSQTCDSCNGASWAWAGDSPGQGPERAGSPLPSTTPSLAQTPHLKICFCWLITCCNSLISFSLPLSISSCFIM